MGLAACATPIAPPGGPEDTTPPRLVESVPAMGAVDVRTQEVVLTFSELLDPASARQAVDVTPEPETPPEIEVRGRRLTVRFREPLRDSTTYVVTLGTALSDNHRVRLPAAIPFAFATGPQLDDGRIAGLVRNPETGAGVAGMSVFAYAAADTLPDPRTAAPDYRTQTGADGAFELAYLRDAPFFVVAVQDDNRNRRADAGEPFAVPADPRIRPSRPASTSPAPIGSATLEDTRGEAGAGEADEFDLDDAARPLALAPDSAHLAPLPETAGADSLVADTSRSPAARSAAERTPLTFWKTALDTIPPLPRSARALTDRRVAVRFDQAVLLPGGTRDWSVADSASAAPVPVAAAYRLPDAPQQVVLQLDTPLPAARTYTVRLDSLPRPGGGPAVADSAGNAAAPFTLSFSPSSTPDTLTLRLDAFLPDERALVEGALPAGARPGARFTLPPPDAALSATDTLGAPLALPFATDDGLTFRLAEPPMRPVRLTATLPDTTQSQLFRPAPDQARGALLGTVRADSALAVPAGTRIGVEVWATGAAEPLRLTAEPDGRFSLTALPAGDYRLRFWLDVDGDGRWSGGRLAPYRAAEPLLLLDQPERVRARWDTEIEDLVIGPPR